MQTSEFNTLVDRVRDRRRFLAGAGIAGVAAVVGSSNLGLSAARAAGSKLTATDVEVLNFALNLEYLEAQFYNIAAGRTIPAGNLTGSGTQGAVTGGSKVSFSNPHIAALAGELATEELFHVKFIREALAEYGERPVAQPAINLKSSFTTLARAAGLVSSTQTFDPFESDLNFLLGAYVFEDVGVTAYGGAAGLVSPAILGYAAGIMAVEAYHAGAIRMLAYTNSLAPDTVKISNLRATLDGTAGTAKADDTGVLISGSSYGDTRIVDRDSNGIAFTRNTSQVLSIVYGSKIGSDGSPSTHKGLFFPAGMNGAIK